MLSGLRGSAACGRLLIVKADRLSRSILHKQNNNNDNSNDSNHNTNNTCNTSSSKNDEENKNNKKRKMKKTHSELQKFLNAAVDSASRCTDESDCPFLALEPMSDGKKYHSEIYDKKEWNGDVRGEGEGEEGRAEIEGMKRRVGEEGGGDKKSSRIKEQNENKDKIENNNNQSDENQNNFADINQLYLQLEDDDDDDIDTNNIIDNDGSHCKNSFEHDKNCKIIGSVQGSARPNGSTSLRITSSNRKSEIEKSKNEKNDDDTEKKIFQNINDADYRSGIRSPRSFQQYLFDGIGLLSFTDTLSHLSKERTVEDSMYGLLTIFVIVFNFFFFT